MSRIPEFGHTTGIQTDKAERDKQRGGRRCLVHAEDLVMWGLAALVNMTQGPEVPALRRVPRLLKEGGAFYRVRLSSPPPHLVRTLQAGETDQTPL